MGGAQQPIVLVTGAAGNIGRALIGTLEKRYRVVGLDQQGGSDPCEVIAVDLRSQDSVTLALETFRERHGGEIASVVHLAAYFDFTGEEHPLYDEVNVEGTRRLLRALGDFDVGQFVYSGTMLVHQPGAPGHPITEASKLAPKWAYPKSKARAEQIIRDERGEVPCALLHMAGLYDDRTAVPTLAQQIRRIYERDVMAHAYPDRLDTGQAFVHKSDAVEALALAVDRRADLPAETTILIGEAETLNYGELQQTLAEHIHGEPHWRTVAVPKSLAAVGAWVQAHAEPVVPDDFDQGEKPFIRPFMVAMADDHYELDITRARELLGWEPRHSLKQHLPAMVDHLKRDPLGWYEANGITPPDWLEAAGRRTDDPEAMRLSHEARYRQAHGDFIWAPFLNMALGSWLVAGVSALDYGSAAMVWSDVVSGLLIIGLSLASLSWQMGPVRWLLAGLGCWVMFAPLVFWAPTATAYLNDTLVGALVVGFAVLARPPPGVALVAAETGPTVPPGWDFSPSSWFQRLPIILLAVVGLYISRYMAAYQLGHVDGVWDPFFSGTPENAKNGTEEIITSRVSQAWPVPDAGLGALTYMFEILVGMIGSTRRWRTMPWLVVLFGIMIVPLGVVSITFIIIQPIVLGTWCTLCLVAATVMLVQIPYSLDELVATGQFLMRRRKAGRPILRVFFVGDTDIGDEERQQDSFAKPPSAVVREMVSGGVGLPWTLAVSILIGIWLMWTRATLGTTGGMADIDHLVGALAITFSVTALAEVARPVRFFNTALGLALMIAPFIVQATVVQTVSSLTCGLALVCLSVPRGKIRNRYGGWGTHAV